jgi:hypothetical protein
MTVNEKNSRSATLQIFWFAAQRTHWPALLLLLIIPVLANAGFLFNIINCDPESRYGGLLSGAQPGILSDGACFVDPAPAEFVQPLGFVSAQDWLHGVIPWWNPYIGIGMPLAAEMQNESLFLPFVLLLHFHAGWFIQRLLFQILSGLFTYAFLIELKRSRLAALAGGILFALNGVFILTAGTVSATVFCLPLLLLGIEHARRKAENGQAMGWSLIPLAVAASIYAGFPETAYLNGLFAAAWAGLRLLQLRGKARRRLFTKLCLGAGIGTALAAPQILPFLQYLANDPGAHAYDFAHDKWPGAAAPVQFFVLFYGAFNASVPASLHIVFYNLWVRIGGWFGCMPTFLALHALVSGNRQERSVRILLIGWILAWQARYYGLPGAIPLFGIIPGMSMVDAVRYGGVSVSFALFSLAAFGFDDFFAAQRPAQARYRATLLLFLLGVVASIAAGLHAAFLWFRIHPQLLLLSIPTVLLAITGTLALSRALAAGRGRRASLAFVAAGSIITFFIPQLAAPRGGHEQKEAITFLQQHVGLARVYSLGNFSGNFLAPYGVGSINYFQLPAPDSWIAYIRQRLFPWNDPQVFNGNTPGQLAAFAGNPAAYEALGVKYVTTDPGTDPFSYIATPFFGPVALKNAPLLPGQSATGRINSMIWLTPVVQAVAIRLGTFGGQSNGALAVQLCFASQCAAGQAALATAADDGIFTVPLTQPLTVHPDTPLTYRITYLGTRAVAIWLASDMNQPQNFTVTTPDGTTEFPGMAPQMGFTPPPPAQAPKQVLHSQVMDIYELPNPAPYAEASDPACGLRILSRQEMQSSCPHPASLTRRELAYPGWRASINGLNTPVHSTADIFQQIALPAGTATIRFSYMPPYMPLAVGSAVAALLLWLGCALWATTLPANKKAEG